MTEDSLPKIKVDLHMPQVKQPKLQSFSFSAEPNMPERVHRLGEYYGQSHLSFSEKVAYLICKLEILTEERKWTRSGGGGGPLEPGHGGPS